MAKIQLNSLCIFSTRNGALHPVALNINLYYLFYGKTVAYNSCLPTEFVYKLHLNFCLSNKNFERLGGILREIVTISGHKTLPDATSFYWYIIK